jgi:hypothetical protein
MKQNRGNPLLFRRCDNTGPIGHKPGWRHPSFAIVQKAPCLLRFEQKHAHELVMGFHWRNKHIPYSKKW